jgi:hypothetical protein
MEHIEKSELILIASGRNSSVDQIIAKQQHLKQCESCRKQIAEIKIQLRKIKTENEQICETIVQQLYHSLDNSHPLELSPDLQQHFKTCDDCRALFMLYQRLSLDQIDDTDVDIPEERLEILTQKLYTAIRKLRGLPRLEPLISPTFTLKSLINKIRTIAVETEPVLLFSPVRGEIIPGKQIFCHKGGKIRFQTHHNYKKVVLYAIFNEKFYEKMTDANGEVVFDNLLKDDYRIEIDGYEIKNISDIIIN